MAFLDENYLLTSPLAHELYDEIAALPILDPHNHCDVKALAEDRGFTDIWDAEGATDHYVWELERKCGVPEELITGKAADKEEAKGSGHVPMPFLKQFYRDAYRRLRAILPKEKVIVFHDGFRLGAWKDFFVKEDMENVALDTHIYVFAMENFVPIHKPWVYRLYINFQRRLVQKAARYTPVIVGEWCISNKFALAADTEKEKTRRFRWLAGIQKKAWSVSAGYIYWNYQLRRDLSLHMDEEWKDSWDLRRCWQERWM